MVFLSEDERKFLSQVLPIFNSRRRLLFQVIDRCTQQKLTGKNYTTEYYNFYACIRRKILENSVDFIESIESTKINRTDIISKIVYKIAKKIRTKTILSKTQRYPPLEMEILGKIVNENYEHLEPIVERIVKEKKLDVSTNAKFLSTVQYIAYLIIVKGAIEVHFAGKLQ